MSFSFTIFITSATVLLAIRLSPGSVLGWGGGCESAGI
jgi:hypothetical protein